MEMNLSLYTLFFLKIIVRLLKIIMINNFKYLQNHIKKLIDFQNFILFT